MSDGMIRVGRVGDDVFISVPPHSYERVVLPLTEGEMHAVRFSVEDTRWLIRALKKELRLREPRFQGPLKGGY